MGFTLMKLVLQIKLFTVSFRKEYRIFKQAGVFCAERVGT
jgi:hypothetical protein